MRRIAHPRAQRALAALACVALASLLLACVTLPWAASQGAGAQALPRWSCPTPTPRPYGPAGPVKGYQDGAPDPTSGIPIPTPIYYQQWEQEDFDGQGAPFPAPTPYAKLSGPFFLGQLVNLTPDLDVRADVTRTEVVSGELRLYAARLTWRNRGAPFTFAPARQIALSAVRRADGTLRGGAGWRWSAAAARLAGSAPDAAALRATVPAGASEQVAPILAPDGAAQTLDLQLDLGGELGGLRVQWARGADPGCAQDGTEAAVYDRAAPPLQGAPPPVGASDLVAFALAQVGRPYCWGGKGWDGCDGYGGGARPVTPSCAAQGGAPCWDCSGLTWGSYKAAGMAIGQGTANQSRYPAVWRAGDATDPAMVAQPGDLLLFTAATAGGGPAGGIAHVGLYAGDGLLIHAANYPDGVIATPHIFQSRYYAARLALITRPPRG